MTYEAILKDIIHYQQRIYQGGYSTSSGGNVSIKITNTIYITPTGKDKGALQIADLAAFRVEDHKIISDAQPSCEMKMHAEIYQRRPDVGAILHAHPIYTTVLDLLEIPLETDILSESYIFIPRVAYVKYAMPSSCELAALVADQCTVADVLILSNHGIVICGKNLEQCFQMLEVAEETAKIQYLLLGKGPFKHLNAEQREEIDLSFHQTEK
jgi:L-fuculose-phosphate aldolase